MEQVTPRVIKGSTFIKAKTGDKQPVKRKSNSKAVSKPAKISKSDEVEELKNQVKNLYNMVQNVLKSKGSKPVNTATSDISDNGDKSPNSIFRTSSR